MFTHAPLWQTTPQIQSLLLFCYAKDAVFFEQVKSKSALTELEQKEVTDKITGIVKALRDGTLVAECQANNDDLVSVLLRDTFIKAQQARKDYDADCAAGKWHPKSPLLRATDTGVVVYLMRRFLSFLTEFDSQHQLINAVYKFTAKNANTLTINHPKHL